MNAARGCAAERPLIIVDEPSEIPDWAFDILSKNLAKGTGSDRTPRGIIQAAYAGARPRRLKPNQKPQVVHGAPCKHIGKLPKSWAKNSPSPVRQPDRGQQSSNLISWAETEKGLPLPELSA